MLYIFEFFFILAWYNLGFIAAVKFPVWNISLKPEECRKYFKGITKVLPPLMVIGSSDEWQLTKKIKRTNSNTEELNVWWQLLQHQFAAVFSDW